MISLKIHNDLHMCKKLFLKYPLHEAKFDDNSIVDPIWKKNLAPCNSYRSSLMIGKGNLSFTLILLKAQNSMHMH